MCSAAYSKWPEDGKEEAVINLWLSMFGDVSYEVGAWAVTKFINESVFPPTVADIRSRITDITVKAVKSPVDAWGEVKLAIRMYGVYNERKALESMSETTRDIVRAIGYTTLCMSENEMADRAHFLKVYEIKVKREREDAALMPGLRKAIDRIQNDQSRMLEGGSKGEVIQG
ncbi:replicative helicase loader/inhibitor [Paenibacillus sp. IITD108]|uniref:replicative helicase loader/inhibitor n=1 Tax=Paenibacillus sp. IITD108 TaxID=3116649 RepID=UPI002F3F7E28